MKRYIIVLLLYSFSAISQTPVFKIDSIPTEGILLDKGWKWHAGDNPDFAKPDFDDSHWESIDPTKDADDLPQIKKVGIGWIRINLKLDSTLKNTILSLYTYQGIASEFYYNGLFIGNFGRVSQNPDEVKAFFSFNYLKPVIHLYTGEKEEQVLSIRFAYKDFLLYQRYDLHKSSFLSVVLNITDPKKVVLRDAFHGNNYEQFGNFDVPNLDYFKAGLFFILCILHLSFYHYNRFQKANIFFGLGCFLLFIIYLYQATINRYFYDMSYIQIFTNIYWFIRHPAYIFQLTAVYLIFNIRIGWIYKSLSLVVLLALFMPIFRLNFAFLYDTNNRVFISTAIFFEVTRISILAYRAKKDGAKIILTGSICFVLLIFATYLFHSYLLLNENMIILHVLTNLGTLSIPISITLFLSREFAQTSKSLKLTLDEVQVLSLEKQATLQKQNAELQAALLKGQTTERQRVALDLHDNLGSTLTSIGFSMEAIDKSKMTDTEKDIYKNLQEMVTKAYNDVRLLSHNLLPEDFEKLGFTATLESCIRKINKNSTLQFHLNID